MGLAAQREAMLGPESHMCSNWQVNPAASCCGNDTPQPVGRAAQKHICFGRIDYSTKPPKKSACLTSTNELSESRTRIQCTCLFTQGIWGEKNKYLTKTGPSVNMPCQFDGLLVLKNGRKLVK
jgi:hypothetical protein